MTHPVPTLIAWLLVAGAAQTAAAQNRPASYSEYRVDAIAATNNAVQAGAGVVTPFGTYVRLGLDGAVGPAWHGGAVRTSGRIDAIGRFTLDPLREMPVALSLGGGVTLPFNYTVNRPLLAVVLDVEGRRKGRFTPFLQLGLGGGARLGGGVRTSPLNWR